ncbi:excalibur calcium-binding domain-containing protein [Knoellia pratensis]|uniref:excalibur calcium-binding domain-containing protein n=1 Tax=Knoellia pratensis TaxID=3404796 RepID=UPI003617474B
MSISVRPGPTTTVTVLATPAPAPTVTVTAKPAPAPTVTVTKAPATRAVPFVAPPPQEDSSVYNANCDAARAAGVAPLRRDDPGYRSGLDRDNDGVACE